MELYLNSPAYFSREHGIDDEIYWFFRAICKHFVGKDYSPTIKTVGLMPVVAPNEILVQGAWAESVKFSNTGVAIICKHTDYMEYLNADITGRKRLMVENILASVKKIEKRGKFDYKQFEEDLLKFVKSEIGG